MKQPAKKHSAHKAIAIIAVLFISVIAIVHVTISNRFVSSGKTLVEMEGDIVLLKEKNDDLRQQIASASALLTIEQKAKELGFEKSTATVFIPSQLPVAFGATQ